MSDGATNFTLASIAVIGIGSAVEGKLPNMKLILSGGIVVVGISVMDNASPKLATGFAGLIFFGICFNKLPKIVDKLGLAHGGNDIDAQKLQDDAEKKAKEAEAATKPATPAPKASAFTPAPGYVPGGTKATPQTSKGTA